MAVTIQVRRDTAANWVSVNPVLNQGEPGLETDTGRFKYGDGSTAWTSLGYAAQQLTPTTQTTTYTANPGDYVKANISSASWTMKLPNAPAANTIVGAKVIANATGNANTLTVACSGSDKFETSTGGTSTTLFLANQAAAWQYNSGYWTRISDDLPLGQLDGRYTKVFSPVTYGGVGNGSTDDTTAVAAAFAAAGAVGGTIWLGNYNFKTSSPITLPSNITVAGASPRGSLYATGATAGGITNSATAIFDVGNVSATVVLVTFQNCCLTATNGHVFSVTSGAVMAFWNFLSAQAAASASGGDACIWYMPNGAMYNFLIDAECYFEGAANTTYSPWHMVSAGSDIRGNIWQNFRLQGNTSATVPFFHLEGQASAQYCTDNEFKQIIAETSPSGIIIAYGVSGLNIQHVKAWDVTTFTGNLFDIRTSTGGAYSRNITIKNSGRAGGSFSSSFCDVNADVATGNVVIENVGVDYAGTGVYNLPTGAVIINDIGGVPSLQSGVLTASGGASGLTQPGRFVGSVTAGPPTSGNVGTSAAGDFLVDQTSGIWVCTAGGNPGTWIELLAGAAISDPLQIGSCVTYMPSQPMISETNGTAGNGYYMRLISAGYSIGHILVLVGVSSGNVSAAVYSSSGAGTAPVTQLETTGALACPASGTASMALGASVTPAITDYLAMSCDNLTATFYGASPSGVSSSTMLTGLEYEQASAQPLPSSASSLTATNIRVPALRGTA